MCGTVGSTPIGGKVARFLALSGRLSAALAACTPYLFAPFVISVAVGCSQSASKELTRDLARKKIAETLRFRKAEP
jgi:hypothetical protein